MRNQDSDVYADIRAERSRQDRKHGGPAHDDEHLDSDWLNFIEWQTQLADDARDDAGYRAQLVKVAALAVAAIESHDRRTAALAPQPKGAT